MKPSDSGFLLSVNLLMTRGREEIDISSTAATIQLVTGSRMRGSPTSGYPPEDNGALSAKDAKSPDVRLAATEKSIPSLTFIRMICNERKAAVMRLGGHLRKNKERM